MLKRTNFKFLFKIVLVVFVSYNTAFAQNIKQKNFLDTPNKIVNGITSSLSYYDIPVYLVFLFRNKLPNSVISNKFTLLPFEFDKKFIKESTENKNSSIGSINKDLIPGIVIGTGFAATLGFDLFSETKVSSRDYRRIFMLYKTLMYTYTITEVVKTIVKRERPNKSDLRSFFSGHSSTTFAAVHYVNKELQYLIDRTNISDDFTRTLLKVSSFTFTYGWASVVAYSRMNDNQHYLSDVLIGACAGILISELLHQAFMSEDNNLENLDFSVSQHQVGLSFRVNL